MTRRGFLAAIVPILGTTSPVLGMDAAPQAEGWILTETLTVTGMDTESYFAFGEALALIVNPAHAPNMLKNTQALVGREVVLSLRRAD